MHLLHPILPTGFNSWTQVLTDWGVSGAFRQAGVPRCFEQRPELAAPFVTEISAAIQDEQLFKRASHVALLQEQVTEPTYDRAGGSAFLGLRRAVEATQERYMQIYRRCREGSNAPELVSAREEMERHQVQYTAARRALATEVKASRSAAARDFWANRPARGIPDTFFAHAPDHTAAARMQRLHPPWWGAFLGRLQQTLAHGHPAEGCLLDELPRLRAGAKLKTYEAMVIDWCNSHAEKWGWNRAPHHRMLALRAARKAKGVTTWFNSTAPGYLASEVERFSLHAALEECLEKADPWSVPRPSTINNGIHGRN